MTRLSDVNVAGSNDQMLADIMDQVSARLHAGERLDLDDLLAEYPDQAERLQELWPALRLLIKVSPSNGIPASWSESGSGFDELSAEPLGDFRLIREIGRGGMGLVYEAEQLSLGRKVALKVLPFAATMDAKQLQRFRNEAMAAASLRHENIVHVYGVGCERSVHFYAMELIDGHTLAQIIAATHHQPETPEATSAYQPADAAAPTAPAGALSTQFSGIKGKELYRAAARVIADAADALEHAHAMGIVHRDIKPANLMVDADGKVYVTDFGLARFGPDAGLTMSGDLLGTLRYMSPEQAMARHGLVDHRTDVYSLGATLYELLTGHPAVVGEDKQELLKHIAFEEPTPLRKIDRAIAVELETITLKALAKEPAGRYATAKELAEDLRSWLEDRPIKAKKPGVVKRATKWTKRHKALATIHGLTVLVLVFGSLCGASAWLWRDAEIARGQAVSALDGEKTARTREAEAQKNLISVLNLNRVNMAQRAWMDGDVIRARFLLDSCSGESRNWEWHHVHRLCHEDLFLSINSDQSPKLAFSFDGRRVAATGQREIKIWDTVTGNLLLNLEHGWRRGACVEFSPDGKRIAAAGGVFDFGRNQFVRGDIRVWDSSNGQQILNIPTPPNFVSAVRFSPDGKRIATIAIPPGAPIGMPRPPPDEFPVSVWNAESGEKIFHLSGHTQLINDIAFSADGRFLTSAVTGTGIGWMTLPTSTLKKGQKEIKVWDLTIGRESAGFVLGEENASMHLLKLSPDGRLMASRDLDGILQLWDLSTQKQLTRRPEPGGRRPISDFAFSSDARQMALSWLDGKIQLWDLKANKELRQIEGGTGATQLALSPDATLLGCSTARTPVRIWNLSQPSQPRKLDGSGSIALSPDGRWYACRFDPTYGRLVQGENYFKGVALRDLSTGLAFFTFRFPSAAIAAADSPVALSAGGVRLAALSAPATVGVWDIATGKLTHTLKGQNDPAVRGLAFGPKGRYLADSPSTGILRVWDLDSQAEPITWLAHMAQIRQTVFTRDGRYLISASADKSVRAWDWARSQVEFAVFLGHTDVVNGLAISPDGHTLATCSSDRTIRIWDLDSKSETRLLRGHGDSVNGIDFSPDGTRLASASSDGTVKIWHWQLGEEALTLQIRPPAKLSSIAFSPDGKSLAAIGGRMLVWDAAPPQNSSITTGAWSDNQQLTARIALADSYSSHFPLNQQLQFHRATYRNELAVELLKQNRNDDAQRILKEGASVLEVLIEQHPNEPEYQSLLGGFLHNLSWICTERGDLDQARQLIDRAISLQEPLFRTNDNNAQYRGFLRNHYEQMGLIQQQLGAYSDAAQSFRLALELVPDDAAILNHLAWLLAVCPDPKVRNAPDALAFATRAVAKAPDIGTYHGTLGLTHYRVGNWQSAVAEIEKAIGMETQEDSKYLFFLAMAQWKLGQREQAHKYYAHAIETMKENGQRDANREIFRVEAAELLGIKDNPTDRTNETTDKRP